MGVIDLASPLPTLGARQKEECMTGQKDLVSLLPGLR